MIIGTAGHIDHGKTALVQRLTGVDTDRLQEERNRGITIELGFAYMTAPAGGTIGFVDVPGHERLVHTMLAGASGIDFALLVVAADDGIMPQTREHLAILDLLGIKRGMVALTKADLVDDERLMAATSDLANALLGTALEGAEILPVSSVTGRGLDLLRKRLFEAARQAEMRPQEGAFRLAVDRSFVLHGVGTVVTGTVLSGCVTVNDQVVVSPSGIAARVRGLHVQNQKADRGGAGDRCALNLAGDAVSKQAISRGDMVVAPGLHAPCHRIDARLRVLATEKKPVTQWMPVRLHHAAEEVGARVVLLGEAPIPPGEEGFVQIVPERPIAAAAGDRFVLRDTSAQRTVGGGRLLDLRAPARRRRTPERLGQLEAMALVDPEEALGALLQRSPHYVNLEAFARDHALLPAQIQVMAARAEVVAFRGTEGTLAVSATVWPRLEQAIVEVLDRFHLLHADLPGMNVERLRLQIEPRLPAPVFLSLLRALAEAGITAFDGAWVKLPSHVIRLTEQDELLWEEITPLIGGQERFRPPRVRDIASSLDVDEEDVRKLFKRLSRAGRVHEVAHDHFYLRPTVAEMVEIAVRLAEQAPRGEFSAAQFRDKLECGRKVAINILEFFDRHGITFRRGDMRRMNRYRLELFKPAAGDAVDAPAEPAGGEASLVGRPDFKSGRGREPVLGGFDSHSPPPRSSRSMA